MKKKTYGLEITGHLDIFVGSDEDVLIHGDSEGLRSFADLLLKLADLNQEEQTDFPVGAREHYHLRPNLELGKSSVQAIVGRLDAKGTGEFYGRYLAKDVAKPNL